MSASGHRLNDYERLRILGLLATSELSIPEIAERMNCSRSSVTAFNRQFGIRDYARRRSCWKVGGEMKGDIR